MKKASIVISVLLLFLVAACNVSKKSKKQSSSNTATTTKAPIAAVSAPPPPPPTPTPPPTPPSNPETNPMAPFLLSKPSDGINEPGTNELTAIQAQYKDATLSKLKEGYVIYTQGACLNCHNAKGIYYFKTSDWKGIIDDMGQKAQLSAAQKDAVYKYVLSIKATQPK